MSQITTLAKYFKELLDIDVRLQSIKKIKNTPFALIARYQFYRLHLLEYVFILAESRVEYEITPAEYKKHVELIRKITGKDVIIVFSWCTAFIRKRLINYKLPFIVPGKQMYLPDLAIDLREHFTKARQEQAHLSPSAQVSVLYHLQKDLPQPFTPKELEKRLGYTKMTMTRAVEELVNHGLCRSEKKGKNKLVWFNYQAYELWEKALPLLRNPIKKVLPLHKYPPKKVAAYIHAGINALSETTMISPDKIPVYAIGRDGFNILKIQNFIKIAELKEDAVMQLEVWSYNPALLSQRSSVDNLSLYLSMKDIHDERIQLALNEIMEEFPWQ